MGEDMATRCYLLTTRERAFYAEIDLEDPRTFAVPGAVRATALRNCRRWDVTEGVSELAIKGPGSNATFDALTEGEVLVWEIRVLRPMTAVAAARWMPEGRQHAEPSC